MKTKREIVLDILNFAIVNSCIINPVNGYYYYLKNYIEGRCCPCDNERNNCPCKEAPSEISLNGKCKCGLFWKNLNIYMKYKFQEDK